MSSSGFPHVSAGSFGSQNLNNFNATTQQGEAIHATTQAGITGWYKFTATAAAMTVRIANGNPLITPYIGVFSGRSLDASLLNIGQAAGVNGVATVDLTGLTIGTSYLVALYSLVASDFIFRAWASSLGTLGLPTFVIGRNTVRITKAVADAAIPGVQIYYRIKGQNFPWTLYPGEYNRADGIYEIEARAFKDGYEQSAIATSALTGKTALKNVVDPNIPNGSAVFTFVAANTSSFYALAKNESTLTQPMITLIKTDDPQPQSAIKGMVTGFMGEASLQLLDKGAIVIGGRYEIRFSGLHAGFSWYGWNMSATLADISAPRILQTGAGADVTMERSSQVVATIYWRIKDSGTGWVPYLDPIEELAVGTVLQARGFGSGTKLSPIKEYTVI